MGQIGEWFWRFLAAVMLLAVGWMLWIFHQINPAPIVTSAAFEAAAQASAKQNVQGSVVPASAPAASAPAEAPAEAPEAAAKAKADAREPPVNVERLKLTDSLVLPAPGAKK